MTTGQDDGDAYFAGQIVGADGTVVWDSTQLFTTAPTQAGTMTQLPGGGFYFVGATKLALSGVANTVNNFYTGSTIKINTSYVSYDALTGQSKVIPSTYTANVTQYIAANTTVVLDTGVNVSLGYNSYAGGDITSSYSLDGTHTNYVIAKNAGGLAKLCTDETGNFVGVLNIPANTFKTGERVFRVDNRLVTTDPTSASTYSEATFTASGLSTKSQSIDFAPSIDAAKNTFVQTNY